MSREQISGNTRKRLEVMTQTTDGFLISEADMKMRGPGDMEGTQQSGIPLNLQHASLARDGQILERAREAASAILDAHPEVYGFPPLSGVNPEGSMRLSDDSLRLLAKELKLRFATQQEWGRIS